LESFCPNNFCVSFYEPRDAAWCLDNAQSIMWDNGAYSAFTLGESVDWDEYYRWLEGKMFLPHWAVVPDIIGGSVEDQRRMEKFWPFRREVSAVVYHFGEPVDRLRELVQGWPRIAIGGSVGSFPPGSDAWTREIDAAWDAIQKSNAKPWVHMMRAHSEASTGRWPFASADSASWARHHAEYGSDKWHKLHAVNRTNPTPAINPHMELF
jgi:hypothetical protein